LSKKYFARELGGNLLKICILKQNIDGSWDQQFDAMTMTIS